MSVLNEVVNPCVLNTSKIIGSIADPEHSVWLTKVGSLGMMSGDGFTWIIIWKESSVQIAPKVIIFTLNVVGITTLSLTVPTISYSLNVPLADKANANPFGNGVRGSTLNELAFSSWNVINGWLPKPNEEPLQIGDPVLSATPLVIDIEAWSSISILPVVEATAQFAAGACVVII